MISRPVRNRKPDFCSTCQSLSDPELKHRVLRGIFQQAYYWIPRSVLSFFLIFVLLFYSAEAASGKGSAEASINTNSLLSANYAKWDQPIEVCILPDLMKLLRTDGAHMLKENDGPNPDDSSQEFLTTHPAGEIPDIETGEILDSIAEDRSEVMPDPAILPSEDYEAFSILPAEPAVEELHDGADLPGLDAETSLVEIRVYIEDLQESIRAEREGGTNPIDPELVEQVRELQAIRDQLDLPDIFRVP